MPYKNILVALSFQYDESPVIHEAARLAQALNTHLTALHVNDPGDGKITMMMPPTGSKEDVSDLLDEFRKAGYPELAERMDARVVTDYSFEEAIIEAAQHHDLLVIGHKQVSALKAAFTDSTDEEVTNEVNCPVLTVPIR